MREFQGWTPATVDNLTFDQLDRIFDKLNKYREHIPSAEVSLENIKRAIFKWLNVKESGVSGSKDDGGVKPIDGFTVTQATKEEMQAWYKTKMKDSLSVFLKRYRKEHKK